MENAILAAVLIVCVITDIRSRKILNWVTLPAIVVGLLYYTVTAGMDGFLFSGLGFLVGLALLFIPFALGGIGAGDVKLLAAIGAVKGALFVFYAFLLGAVIGGLIALAIMLRRKELGGFLKRIFFLPLFLRAKAGTNLSKKDLAPAFPYGVAIALGTVSTYLMETFK